MKAAVYTRYGSPDVLRIEEVEKPTPKAGEVLVKVRAASVNPLDSYFMRGKPYVFRLMTGLRRPKLTRPGVDLAGQVEAVGAGVTRFRPGDEVFGASRGSFAEYVCADERRLSLKPEQVTFEQAGAVNVAGLTALQGLRDRGRIQPGQKVLINGAAGGVGSFAVQIAKSFGTHVTGVCSSQSVDLVRSIGADHVVDYTREDFTRTSERFDLLFDCVADHALRARLRLLKPGGMYVVVGVGGPGGAWVGPFARLVSVVLLSMFAKNVVMFVAATSPADLGVLRELMQAKKLRPVVERTWPLSEAAEAVRHLQRGHARGKAVITMGE